jgi:hypothetical protein
LDGIDGYDLSANGKKIIYASAAPTASSTSVRTKRPATAHRLRQSAGLDRSATGVAADLPGRLAIERDFFYIRPCTA